MSAETWEKNCLREIDQLTNNGRKSRRLSDREKALLVRIRPSVENGCPLSKTDQLDLRDVYCRVTDPVRIFK